MSDVTIRCRKDGPLIVTGDVTLTDHEGNVYDTSGRENVALCRCGETRKMFETATRSAKASSPLSKSTQPSSLVMFGILPARRPRTQNLIYSPNEIFLNVELP
jgi:hypothetical protein